MGVTIRAILIGLGTVVLGAAILVAARVATVEFRDPPTLPVTMRCEEHPPHIVQIRHDLLRDEWEFACSPVEDAEIKKAPD